MGKWPWQCRATSLDNSTELLKGENPSSSYRDMGSTSLAAVRPPTHPPGSWLQYPSSPEGWGLKKMALFWNEVWNDMMFFDLWTTDLDHAFIWNVQTYKWRKRTSASSALWLLMPWWSRHQGISIHSANYIVESVSYKSSHQSWQNYKLKITRGPSQYKDVILPV